MQRSPIGKNTVFINVFLYIFAVLKIGIMMRKVVLFLGTLLAALWISSASFAENKPFITKWKGETGKELKIPIVGTYKLVIKKASDNTVLKTRNGYRRFGEESI